MRIRSASLSFLVGVALGFLFLVAHGLLVAPDVDGAVYVPSVAWLHRARFGVGFGSVLPLFLASFLLGLCSTARWWLVGTAVALSLPVFLMADALNVPADHNLIPFELVFCSPLALAAFLGALPGRALSPYEDEPSVKRPRGDA